MEYARKAIVSSLLLAATAAFPGSPYPLSLAGYQQVNYRTDPDVQTLLRNLNHHQLEPDIVGVPWVFQAMKKDGNVMLMCNVRYASTVHADDGTQCENVRIDYNVPAIPGPGIAPGSTWSIRYDSATFDKKQLLGSRFRPDCR